MSIHVLDRLLQRRVVRVVLNMCGGVYAMCRSTAGLGLGLCLIRVMHSGSWIGSCSAAQSAFDHACVLWSWRRHTVRGWTCMRGVVLDALHRLGCVELGSRM